MAKCFGELNLVKKTATEKDLTCIKYIENGEKILAGSSDGLVRLYDSGTLHLVRIFGSLNDNEYEPMIPVTDVTGLPSRSGTNLTYFIATYANGYVKLWNYEKGEVATTLDEQRQTLGITFSPLIPNFVTVGDDSAIYLYDERTMSVIQTLKSSDSMGKVDGHRSRVFCAEFHPVMANEFISGGWDNTIQFWDIRRPSSVRFITGPHICGHGISFKPGGGKEIITASYAKENPLQRWDYLTGKLLTNYETDIFKSMLYCGTWVGDEVIATGGTDPSLFRVIHSSSNNTIGYFRTQQTGVYSMDFKDVQISESSSDTTKPENLKQKKRDAPVVRFIICAGRFLIELDANLTS